MASATKASDVRSLPHLPLRRPSVAAKNRTKPKLVATAARTQNDSIVWDLDNLPAIREATIRVRQAHSAWQHQSSSAEEVGQLERRQKLNELLAERERRDADQRNANDSREARIAEEEGLVADMRENARQAVLAAEAAMIAEEAERRRLEAEQRRLADEQRRRVEEEFAELLRQEEEEIIRRMEAEIVAEHARLAEEADRRTRQAQAEEQRRRERLRDCAACLEQHDLTLMVELPCEHRYCHDALRGDATHSASR